MNASSVTSGLYHCQSRHIYDAADSSCWGQYMDWFSDTQQQWPNSNSISCRYLQKIVGNIGSVNIWQYQ